MKKEDEFHSKSVKKVKFNNVDAFEVVVFETEEGENILPRRSALFEEEAANEEDKYENKSDEELTDLYRPFT